MDRFEFFGERYLFGKPEYRLSSVRLIEVFLLILEQSLGSESARHFW
ncbi:MAG: hypothetical protein MUC94_01760 [bacterium]|nr:hypothetical protein [bacterium]